MISDDESESDETESSVTDSEATVVSATPNNLAFAQVRDIGQRQASHAGDSISEQLAAIHKKRFTYVVYHGRHRGLMNNW